MFYRTETWYQQFIVSIFSIFYSAYLLAVSTGTRGSDGLTSIKLVGSEATTAFIAVDNPGKNDWESFSLVKFLLYFYIYEYTDEIIVFM